MTQAAFLRKSLQRRHMQMIALGGVIGAGLFVGSGVVIGSAGPAAVISFAITGMLVVLVMRMLAEMAVAYPVLGGFYEYSRLAMGGLAAFLTGWMYWYFWIIVVALEAVAGANLLKTWWPGVAPWEFTLGLTALFTVVNLLSVRSYGEAEFWFASIKVVAIVLFLCAGVLFIAGVWPDAPGGMPHLTAHGGFMPNGPIPVLTGAVAATGFYFGTEIVAVASSESAEPEKAVADAMQSVIWRVLIFYVGSIFLVVSIVAWNDKISMQQPYVSVLRALHVPGATLVMSAIILTAVLSALNSGLFASSRMLMALAVNGDAPNIFAKIDARGVPAAAILAGTAFAYLAVVMSYVSPDKVFAFLVTSYGTVAIFVYVLIAVSELKLRKRLEIDSPERLRVRMWGFPHLTRLAIAGMLAIVAAMGFIPDQRAPLLFGIVSVVVMLLGYGIRQWVRSAGTQRATP